MDPTTYKRRRVRVLLAVGVTTAAIIWATTGNSEPDAETADTPTTTECHTEEVPLGIVITITNLNTGRQTTCFNVAYLPPPVGSIITLNTNNYLLIGELADAPLPVEITW